jgi:hypothetical protein
VRTMSADGVAGTATVAKVRARHAVAPVYDLTVRGTSRYLVGACGVVVHNTGCSMGGAGGARTAAQAGLTPNQATRIQNAADRIGRPIYLVGSRARGVRTGDWDYVIPSVPKRLWSKIRNSLPGEEMRLETGKTAVELFRSPLKPDLPHVPFIPSGAASAGP